MEYNRKGSGGDVNCYGSYSCYNSSIIDAQGCIYCRGLLSCSNIGTLKTVMSSQRASNIYCGAELSCANSILITSSETGTVACGGLKSCINANISTQSEVTSHGAMAGMNSIFYNSAPTNQDEDVSFKFYGWHSGYNSTIICGIGHTCNVICYTNACDKNTIKLLCTEEEEDSSGDHDSDCNINPVFYDSGYIQNGSTYVPDLLKISIHEYSISNNFLTNYENSFNTCLNMSNVSINCGDFIQCSQSDYLGYKNKNKINVSICCTAYESCHGTRKIENNVKSIKIKPSLRCDARQSCDSDTTILLQSDGNAYFTGYESGLRSNIMCNSSTLSNDVICSGYSACDTGTINYANNTYCLGENACVSATFAKNFNVWLYGYESGMSATFTDIGNNIYCSTDYACQDATFTNIGNGLFGIGRYSLYKTKIVNVSNVCDCVFCYFSK